MKILYVITSLGLGGAETITIDLANKIAEKGNNVTILHLREENKLESKISPLIKVLTLNMDKTPKSFVKALLKARSYINEWKPDIVHAQMYHSNIFCRFLKIISNDFFLISTEHSKNIGSKIRMLVYRYTDFLSNLNTNVSEEATNFFIQEKAFKKDKSFTIYNGINLNKFFPNKENKYNIRLKYGIKESDFLFINAARLTEAKDHKNLIDAFNILNNKYNNIKLIILGEGPYKGKILHYLKKNNVSSNIILAGSHLNIEDYYNASDCFVLSSAWEGFGLVLAEAMACGLPVVSTNAGGCSEVINNPNLIVPIRDSVKLAEKMEIIYLLSNDERESLSKENIIKVKRFDINSISNIWNIIYNSKKKPSIL